MTGSLLSLALFVFGPGPLQAAVFQAAGDKRNIVTFESQAPLESIIGRTSALTARLDVDPANFPGAKGRFEVDLGALETGLQMRDDHMKGASFLDVEKFPKAVFEITGIKAASISVLANMKPVDFEALGRFTVHGVTQKISVKATATYMKESDATRSRLPGDLIRVAASFSIRLPDFGIQRPEMFFYRLSESVDIKLDFFTSNAAPADPKP